MAGPEPCRRQICAAHADNEKAPRQLPELTAARVSQVSQPGDAWATRRARRAAAAAAAAATAPAACSVVVSRGRV